MKWILYATGKPRLAYAVAGVEEYLPRLRRHASFEIFFLKDRAAGTFAPWSRQPPRGYRVLLDPRGRELSSDELAGCMRTWQESGRPSIAFLVGGADGVTKDERCAADFIWSLGKLTLQHELALVVVLEQIYRAFMINAGTPYHRGQATPGPVRTPPRQTIC